MLALILTRFGRQLQLEKYCKRLEDEIVALLHRGRAETDGTPPKELDELRAFKLEILAKEKYFVPSQSQQ